LTSLISIQYRVCPNELVGTQQVMRFVFRCYTRNFSRK
jgi:hypothetical protein